jgi:hypothetical protein
MLWILEAFGSYNFIYSDGWSLNCRRTDQNEAAGAADASRG